LKPLQQRDEPPAICAFPSSMAAKGTILVMADPDGPDDFGTKIEDAKQLVLVCHPDDEVLVAKMLDVYVEVKEWWKVERALDRLKMVMQRSLVAAESSG